MRLTGIIFNFFVLTNLVSAYGLRWVTTTRNRELYNSLLAAQQLRDCLGDEIEKYTIDEVDGLGLDVTVKEYRMVEYRGIDKLVHDCMHEVTAAVTMQVTPNEQYMKDEEKRLRAEFDSPAAQAARAARAARTARGCSRCTSSQLEQEETTLPTLGASDSVNQSRLVSSIENLMPSLLRWEHDMESFGSKPNPTF